MLFIDGNTIVSNNYNGNFWGASGTDNLTAGVHNITVAFFYSGGGAYGGSGPGFYVNLVSGPVASIPSGGELLPQSWLYTAAGNSTVNSFVGSGTLNVAGGTLTTGGDNSNTTFNGTIGGAGGITKVGSGMFTLTGASTYTGVTQINGGTLQLGDGDGSGGHDAVLATSGIINNAALVFNVFATQTVNYPISGPAGWTKTGPGTLTLSGSNNYSYTGKNLLTSGTLAINAANAAGLYEGLVSNSNGADTTDPIPQTSIQAVARWGASSNGGNNVYPDWANNTTWGYGGYLDNTSNRPVTYTFGKSFDDSAFLTIDGVPVINDTQGSDSVTNSITLGPGLHSVDLRFGLFSGYVGPPGSYGNYGVGYNTVANTARGGTWNQMGAGDSNTQFYATLAGMPNSSLVMSSNTTLDLSAANMGFVALGSLADAPGSPSGQQVLLGGNALYVGLDNTSTTFSGTIGEVRGAAAWSNTARAR